MITVQLMNRIVFLFLLYASEAV